jgi:hypothetical protein
LFLIMLKFSSLQCLMIFFSLDFKTHLRKCFRSLELLSEIMNLDRWDLKSYVFLVKFLIFMDFDVISIPNYWHFPFIPLRLL